MSLESDIFTALTGLASGRVYPDVALDSPTVPYIVWQQVGGQSVDLLELAHAGVRNARIQVACWDSGTGARTDASALMRSVEEALITSSTLRATPLGAMVADYDEETRRYGARQDFSIWYP